MTISNSFLWQIGTILFETETANSLGIGIPINYNKILSSCESVINLFAIYYTADTDEKDDLAQELRIKVWKALKNRYDKSRGGIYNFAFGVIRLEAKKHVLDAHKYRQRYFEDTMGLLVESQFSTSDLFNHIDFVDFASSFSMGLTPRQREVFGSLIEIIDSGENVYYNHSGKIKSKYIIDRYHGGDKECMRLFSHIKRKLFGFAKDRYLMIHLSTAEVRL